MNFLMICMGKFAGSFLLFTRMKKMFSPAIAEFSHYDTLYL
jgi:hypothetical protein